MGSLAKGVFAESLRKFCGNSAESSRTIRFIAPGKGAEFCGKFAEISRKFAENFLQWPLPERPHKCSADNNISTMFSCLAGPFGFLRRAQTRDLLWWNRWRRHDSRCQPSCPLNLDLGGDNLTPQISGAAPRKHCKTRGFGHSTPKFTVWAKIITRTLKLFWIN